MIVGGLLVLAGRGVPPAGPAALVRHARGRGRVGVGALGVGVFPGNTGGIHALFAMLTFVGGGLAAIVTARVTHPPFRYLSVALGVISLGSYVCSAREPACRSGSEASSAGSRTHRDLGDRLRRLPGAGSPAVVVRRVEGRHVVDSDCGSAARRTSPSSSPSCSA